MQKTIDNLKNQLVGFRLGSISPAFIDSIKVPYFGQQTPLKHLAYSSTNKGSISIVPHDPNMVGTIAKILKEFGQNAYVFSKTTVMVNIPPVTLEEKQKIHAQIKKLGEEAKIAIRNIRKLLREAINTTSKDDKKRLENQIQIETDNSIQKIDQMVSEKIYNV